MEKLTRRGGEKHRQTDRGSYIGGAHLNPVFVCLTQRNNVQIANSLYLIKNNVQTIMSTLPDVHIILQRIHSGAIFITKVVIGSIVSSHPASGTTYCIEMQGLCRHITSHWCCYQRSEH